MRLWRLKLRLALLYIRSLRSREQNKAYAVHQTAILPIKERGKLAEEKKNPKTNGGQQDLNQLLQIRRDKLATQRSTVYKI